jgi:hypothetical protein
MSRMKSLGAGAGEAGVSSIMGKPVNLRKRGARGNATISAPWTAWSRLRDGRPEKMMECAPEAGMLMP